MINKTKKQAVVAFLVIVSLAMTSCSYDFNKAGEAFVHLGENLDEAVNSTESASETDTVEEITDDEEVDEDIEASEEVEETVEDISEPSEIEVSETLTTAVPTEAPTPTPTEAPERVDFSDLTEDELTDSITVEVEEFAESYVDANDITYGEFEGTRLLIENEDAINVQTSVNLMLDGFYQEALGIYNRYLSETLAEYALDGVIIEEATEDTNDNETAVDTDEEDVSDEEGTESDISPVSVSCDYEYGFNGRVLSVVMTYEAVRGDEVLEQTQEFINFDLYTGSILTTDAIIEDEAGFYATAENLLAFNYASMLTDEISDEDEDEIEIPDDMEFTDIQIFVRNDRETMYICGVAPDGTEIRALADYSNYSEYFTRYGRILFGN